MKESDVRNDASVDDKATEAPRRWIVGLGASAGGLEALQNFFSHMPDNSGLSFVVIQHLSPDYKSLMVELLSKSTEMNVLRIEDGMPVEPNSVYLIPPKKNVTISDNKLRLLEQDHGQGLNLPIDMFFRSLAEDSGENSVAIVLSGTGSDGSRGIRSIKESGGMVMVQDPVTAKFDGMPASAIATGLADYIIGPEVMPHELLKFVKHPVLSSGPRRVETLGSEEDTLSKIISVLRRHSGVDFTYYKPSTVVRRIERRMGVAQVQDLADYFQYLQQSPNEVTSLYKDLLIGVTKFFRDAEAFAYLENNIIPKLFRSHQADRTIRVWIAGCSTGEEAYSIAMLLREQMNRMDGPYDVKVFATDIDRDAIEVASVGSYPVSIVPEVSSERLKRFFVERGGAFQVSREIREMVVFAPQNLLKDPPFTKIDLVCCRNLLIYLQPVLQKKVLALFAFALRDGGSLFLGSSETIGDLSDLFEPLELKLKMFERRPGNAIPLDASLSVAPVRERLMRAHFGLSASGKVEDTRLTEERFIADIHARLLGEYAPTSFVLDENGDLLHTFGKVPEFMKISSGRATLSVLKMLPKELSLALATAMHRAIKEREPVLYSNIRVGFVGETKGYNLKVEPLSPNTSRQLHLLVIIQEWSEGHAVANAGSEFPYDPQVDQSQRIVDLEQELQMSRENLQATIEELETSNEELQATNEELLAANEELQSTNEELQSVNEELYTVNAEYQSKISELTELNNDMDNFLGTSDIGTIFLDRNLRIRKFTSSVAKEIHLLPHDVGRPIHDIAAGLLKEVCDCAGQALLGNATERTVKTETGHWLLLRILPYRTKEAIPQGVIVTIVDVTRLKEAEESLKETTARLQAILHTAEVGICVTDEEGLFVELNDAFAGLYGYKREELIGKSFFLLVEPSKRDYYQTEYNDFLSNKSRGATEITALRKDGSVVVTHTTSSLLEPSPGRKFKLSCVIERSSDNVQTQMA